MTAAALDRLFREEQQRYPSGFRARSLRIDPTVPRSPRAMAYAEGNDVFFYARALELPRRNLVALLRHELAHVALSKAVGDGHTEREADGLAELMSGEPIRYDRKGLQTTGCGRRPRPAGLR